MKERYGGIDIVDNYMKLFESGITENKNFHRVYELCKNLSYNTQYLEYLSYQFDEKLHTTIKVMYTKTFVITGIGIIESILYYFLKSENLHRVSDIKEITKIKSNIKKLDEKYLKTETIIYEIIEPYEQEMSLSQMLNKTEQNNIFGNNHEIYPKLKRLRNLRNKIHLYTIEKDLDHDLNNFSRDEMDLMKECLKEILFSDKFKLSKERKIKLLSFL